MVWPVDNDNEENHHEEKGASSSWTTSTHDDQNIKGGSNQKSIKDEDHFQMDSNSSFKSMLEDDSWYLTSSSHNTASMHGATIEFTEAADNILPFQPLDLCSTSCSPKVPSSVLVNNLDDQLHNYSYLFPTNSNFIQNPLDPGSYFTLSSTINAGLGFTEGGTNFFLKPLDADFVSAGGQPTLFQKRAAAALMRISNLSGGDENHNDEIYGKEYKVITGNDLEDASVDETTCNNVSCDTDDGEEEEQTSGKNGGRGGSGSTVTCGGDVKGKGKKKAFPAKNLMAERRRRKKLNDRLLMLRSVVPKISKMDRTSILGDAVEYLNELLQKINDLQSEIESTSSCSSLTTLAPTSSFYPSTPTFLGLPHIKEERCPSAFSSPLSSPTEQSACRVEVKISEDKAVSIHMFCGCRPGLLVSIMKTIDNLGLDVQQAVISNFNGLTLDIFRAEQEGQELHADQIKSVLLDSAGFHGLGM